MSATTQPLERRIAARETHHVVCHDCPFEGVTSRWGASAAVEAHDDEHDCEFGRVA